MTRRVIVRRPPGGRQTFTVPFIAILTGYRAGALVTPAKRLPLVGIDPVMHPA